MEVMKIGILPTGKFRKDGETVGTMDLVASAENIIVAMMR
jgi:hypothetical protein